MYILDLLQDKQYPKKAILEKLICHSTGLSKEQLFTHAEKELEEEQKNWIQRAYTQYVKEHKPLEYILGYVKFSGLKFTVSPDTLIPRPETEYMIEAVGDEIKHTTQYTVLDIGTGCGVLGLTTLYYHQKYIKQLILTDISTQALEVAKQNYKQHFGNTQRDAKVQFLQANLLDHPEIKKVLDPTPASNTFHSTKVSQDYQASNLVPHFPSPARSSSDFIGHSSDFIPLSSDFIIIIANLPYIPEQLFDENTDETVKKREPKTAFVGGDNGLKYYREMLNQIIKLRTESKELRIHSSSNSSPARSSSDFIGPSSDFIMFLEMMTRQVKILHKEYPQFTFEEVKTFHFNIKIVKAKLI